MAEDMKLKNAQTVYKTLCDMLDARKWHYNKKPEDLIVRFEVVGDDLPMEFVAKIDVDRELIRLLSFLPFKFPEDKRVEGAIATSQVNFGLCDGSFDFNILDGRIDFRMTSSFRDSLISQELFAYMIDCACATVDEYNDKFLMLGKGMLDLEKFLKDC